MGVENTYYNAKQMKAENPEEAITEFLGLPRMEEEKGDWYGDRLLLQRVQCLTFQGVLRVSSKPPS